MAGKIAVHYPAGTGVIMQRTIGTALLSAPQYLYPIGFSLDKVPANLGRQSVVLGWVPAAASTVKLVMRCRNATTGKVQCWPVNAAGSLLCASTFTPATGTLVSATLTVTNLAAGERLRLWAKSSTTTSACGVDVTLWCKGTLTT